MIYVKIINMEFKTNIKNNETSHCSLVVVVVRKKFFFIMQIMAVQEAQLSLDVKYRGKK